MSAITITIETDNAAFDGDGGALEVQRILSELVGRIAQWDANLTMWNDISQTLRDANGNTVGTARFTR